MPLPPDSSSANRKSALDEDGVPEEPPPSCKSFASPRLAWHRIHDSYASTDEASHGNSDQVVAAGPSRPFQPPPTLPPRPQPYAQPPPQPPGNAHAATGVYSPFPPQNPLPGQNRPSLDAYTTGSASSSVPPDQPPVWEPTTVPRPGHPLLNVRSAPFKSIHRSMLTLLPLLVQLGKVLNYSQGYECSKCYNTGYKESNPSKPCRKVSSSNSSVRSNIQISHARLGAVLAEVWQRVGWSDKDRLGECRAQSSTGTNTR